LRIEGEKLGYPRDFTIYDTDDSRSLIKSIVKEMDLDDKIYKPSVVHNRISAAKNRLISWEDYLNDPIIQEDDLSAQRPKIGAIYKQYQARAFRSGAMDFDDLLFNTNVLLRDHPSVLNKYQQKFEHVMVDEYQDTNVSQYLITKKLSAVHQNICVVGDDAQSIYAFRGADISNILNFEKDYPELKTFRLEQNYRSTKNIVAAANDVIKNNKHQLKKNVWTDNSQGELIEVIKSSTDQEEANLIATTIFEERANHSYKYTDFAVLYRTNAQSRQLEEAFRRRSIPYKIVGGLSFYQRKEVKDLLAWLRFVINQHTFLIRQNHPY
jgi:DNA helicase-2/ATP-dependent DNA helicase PcrA